VTEPDEVGELLARPPNVAAGYAGGGDMGVPRIPISMLGYFMLFFMLGYFLYASIYTTIAAPFASRSTSTKVPLPAS